MVVILFRQAKGAPQVLARAEADEFVNQLVIAAQIMGRSVSSASLRKEGPGGHIAMGEDVVEVDPPDVAIEINFDPEPLVSDALGAEPTDTQLHLAAVVLDETARFHIRQGLLLQAQAAQQQAREVEERKRGLRLVKSLKERELQ